MWGTKGEHPARAPLFLEGKIFLKIFMIDNGMKVCYNCISVTVILKDFQGAQSPLLGGAQPLPDTTSSPHNPFFWIRPCMSI